MKRLLVLLLIVLATTVVFGGSEKALADGGKGASSKPVATERVVDRSPAFDNQGRFIGYVTTVIGSVAEDTSDGMVTTSAVAATYPTRTKTCYSKVWLNHFSGLYKVWEMKLSQTWGYNGSKIVWYYGPDVTAWSKYGWSHTPPTKGIYWTQYHDPLSTCYSPSYTSMHAAEAFDRRTLNS